MSLCYQLRNIVVVFFPLFLTPFPTHVPFVNTKETLALTLPAQRVSQTLSLSPSRDSARLRLAFEAFLI